jgi:hypothetical protein
MRNLLLLLALLPIPAVAQCVAVENAPQYHTQMLPGSIRQINVNETGCPGTTSGATITSLSADGTYVYGIGTGFAFTVGKKIIITAYLGSGYSYGFDTMNGVPMEITAATSTTFTALEQKSFTVGLTSSFYSISAIQASQINWSTTTGTGAVTGTLGCASNCAASVSLTLDTANNGTCSVTGAGPYALTSTQILNVTATPVDNPSGAVTFPVYKCGNTTTVAIKGSGYSQAFEGQTTHLEAGVIGNTNPAVTWAITSSPSGGNGTLDGAVCQGSTANSCRETYFNSGTVTGRYTITATSVADGTKSDYRIVYVAPVALPAYASAPPDMTGSFPCYVDPALTGTDYEVGSGQPYTTVNSALAVMTGGGNIVRIQPGTYAEYVQINQLGTHIQPNVLCGMADGSGHHPWLDGSGANGPSYFNPYAYGTGIINTFSPTTCFQAYPTRCGPANLWISNINTEHATAGYTANCANTGVGACTGGTGTTFPWGDGSAGADIRNGSYISVVGMHCNFDSQCVGTYNNGDNQGYGAQTFSVEVARNYAQNSGLSGSTLSHPFYLQSFMMSVYGNLEGPPVSGSSNSGIKVRGIGVTLNYNATAAGFARNEDWVEPQDDLDYVNMPSFINNGFAVGDTTPIDVIAGNGEAIFSGDNAFGNTLNDPTGSPNVHYLSDSDDLSGNLWPVARLGRLNSFFNTYYECAAVYDTTNGGDNAYYTGSFYLANNIWYCPSGAITFNTQTLFIGIFQTNLTPTGSYDNSLPITGCHVSYGTCVGWSNNYNAEQPLFSQTIDQWLTGSLASSNFLVTSTTPFNTTTLVPTGAALGAATALTGPAAQFNVSRNAVNGAGVVTVRTNMNDLGAVQGSSTPAAPTQLSGHITISGNAVIQ